eukprot:9576746-Alexandrium_andersonii.AAC.1
MCIRDRRCPRGCGRHGCRLGRARPRPQRLPRGLSSSNAATRPSDGQRAVSYTHLTLPTICSV